MSMENAMDMDASYGPEKVTVLENEGQFVTFICCNNAYGIDIMSVREIRSWSPTTILPDQPHAACGVLEIRGEVIQVYDLGMLLGLGCIEATDGHVVLVISLEAQTIGILVDSVSDIIQVKAKALRPPPAGSIGRGIVEGLIKHEDRMLSILNLEPVL
ncbi:chemotaxis protein CheW [Maritalea porphyrae]|uniref:chemotaxis protein CheW n=1 Tax=Maritalea porphyrae TaxID=880732 RepID=UPI0022AFB14B|nr:chemotaxis protein CheW [Maritalea porphyrae]MCZ4271303.1 chemotaxis protein CheW [Maritalea porphyrae]